MKIVQVIESLGLGGAERVCVNLTNLLYRSGASVKIIILNKDGELFDLIDKGIEVVILYKKENKFKAYKEFKKHVEDVDVIHVHMRNSYRFVKKAFLFYGGSKPVILHDHYGKIVVNQRVPYFYKSFFKPDLFIGCSKLLTDWAINKVKIDKDKVFLVNNFVMKYTSETIVKNKKGFVLVGNLKKVKNHKLAVDIAKSLDKELTIYCSGLNKKNQYCKELLAYIEDLDYTSKVYFITGCNNVQLELKKYEFALLTSTSEGDPLALVEYLAQGIPFLCSNIGESVKVIEKYFPSFVQKNFNVDDWVKNYYKSINISQQEIEKVYEENFSSKLYLEKYKSIYNLIN